MRTLILGFLLTVGLAWLGASPAAAAPVAAPAIGQAADTAPIVHDARRVVRRRCVGRCGGRYHRGRRW